MERRRYSALEREELLKFLSNWPESIAGFAKVHGVSVGTLNNWNQQLADRSPEADLGFVEIGQPLSSELGVH
jgi:transposase-like protein